MFWTSHGQSQKASFKKCFPTLAYLRKERKCENNSIYRMIFRNFTLLFPLTSSCSVRFSVASVRGCVNKKMSSSAPQHIVKSQFSFSSLFSKHAKRHPNFNPNVLRQRRPASTISPPASSSSLSGSNSSLPNGSLPNGSLGNGSSSGSFGHHVCVSLGQKAGSVNSSDGTGSSEDKMSDDSFPSPWVFPEKKMQLAGKKNSGEINLFSNVLAGAWHERRCGRDKVVGRRKRRRRRTFNEKYRRWRRQRKECQGREVNCIWVVYAKKMQKVCSVFIHRDPHIFSPDILTKRSLAKNNMTKKIFNSKAIFSVCPFLLAEYFPYYGSKFNAITVYCYCYLWLLNGVTI